MSLFAGDGILLESAFTNLLLQSNAPDTSPWNLVSGATATAAGILGPDGTTNAWVIDVSNGSFAYQSVSVGDADGTPYALGFWMRAISTSGSQAVYNPETNTSGQWAVDLSLVSTTKWEWIDANHPAVNVIHPFTTLSGVIGIFFANGLVPSRQFYFAGGQIETGAYTHRYLPTTTVPVTHAGDELTKPSTKLPVAKGRVELDYTPEWGGATPGSGATFFSTYTNTTGIFIGVQSGTLGVFIETGAYNSAVLSWAAGRKYHIKLVWGAGNMALYRDGALVCSVTDGSVPTLTAHGTFYVGAYFAVDGFEANGRIANLKFYAS